MQIKIYENDLRARACAEILSSSDRLLRFSRVLLLPIPSTRDGIHIAGCALELGCELASVGEGDLVVGYALSAEAELLARSRGAEVFDAASDEVFLSENAELTSLAALGILLGASVAPSDMRVGIVGLGRIGERLLYKLAFLGARPRVYTTRPELRLGLAEDGIESELCPYSGEVSDLDFLVNTAPARLFDFASIAEGVRVLELASGNNFKSTVALERYPSLPARVYPVSAGRVWAESILRFAMSGGYPTGR